MLKGAHAGYGYICRGAASNSETGVREDSEFTMKSGENGTQKRFWLRPL